MDTNKYAVTDSLIKLYDKEGVDMPSGIQSGSFSITEFAPTGFPYNPNITEYPDYLLSDDSQITHFGINAGRVLPYVVAPQPYQDIWQIVLPAGAVTYVKLQTDLFPGFQFEVSDVELIQNDGISYVKLDCPRSLNYINSATTTTGKIELRICGTDFYGRKQVQVIDQQSFQTFGFSTVSSIRVENTYNEQVTVTIGTFSGIGLPYADSSGYNYLGALYNFQPLLTSSYGAPVYDSTKYIFDPSNSYLPILLIPFNNIPNFAAGKILITKQAVYGFGSIPTDFPPEKFNDDLYSNVRLIVGINPPADNWIGWRG